MKSIYVYEEPIDLLKESYRIMKKIRKTTALNAQLAIVDGDSPSKEDQKLNRISCSVLKMIESECPYILKELD